MNRTILVTVFAGLIAFVIFTCIWTFAHHYYDSDLVDYKRYIVEGPLTPLNLDKRQSAKSSPESLNSSRPLQICPETPPNLVGPFNLDLNNTPTWEDLYQEIKEVSKGGFWSPPHCEARHRVAIIIPFRDRDEHLRIFLKHMHPFLQRQELHYRIYVVQQTQRAWFNRAMLINIGYVVANHVHKFDCVLFHDVDLLPENDTNIYSCPEYPRLLSTAVKRNKYRASYAAHFGGVGAIRNEHFEKMNGAPNRYFGWGGEDDDLFKRVIYAGFNLTRSPIEIGRYTDFLHERKQNDRDRFNKLKLASKFFKRDGLNSLKYELLAVEERKLYTWVYADIDKKHVMAAIRQAK